MEADAKARADQCASLIADASRLRAALDSSMTRITRMSTDSADLIDRRVVAKLLVTYFVRDQSPEVRKRG